MKTFYYKLILISLLSTLFAQEADSLKNRSSYLKLWETAMTDGKISSQERLMMNVLIESLVISADSVQNWEQLWGKKYALETGNSLWADELDQSGRWPLVLQNIAWGTGLYGWGIPYVLNADDFRWYTGGVMISAGSAFYLTYQYTKNMEMTHARTQMMRYGSLLGFRYGLGINQLLDLNGMGTREDKKAWMWVLMASVPAGHYGGELLFERYNPSNGQAWAWTMWTGVAGVTARLAHSVVDESPTAPIDDWYNYDEAAWDKYHDDHEAWSKRKTITELVAYPVGIWAGYHLTKDKQYTFGDALMLMQGWGYGYFNTMMLQSILFDDGDEDTFFLISGLGGIGGAYVYDRWIKNDDYSFGQSTLMLLGSGSGLAFGFGTAIMLDLTDKEPMLTMAMAGYGAGTWLTRKILDVKPNGALAQSSSTMISLNPIAMPVSDPNQKYGLIPALSLNISFK